MTAKVIIKHTVDWIKQVVIECNFCPFAAKALLKNSVRYTVIKDTDSKKSLQILINEFEFLDKSDSIETSFIIFKNNFKTFKSYLLLFEKVEDLIFTNNYEGIYQIASFHPKYCFAGSTASDPANYTNRSPYPMIHILREQSITNVLKFFPNPETIPNNNIDFAREKGLKYMQLLRSACMN